MSGIRVEEERTPIRTLRCQLSEKWLASGPRRQWVENIEIGNLREHGQNRPPIGLDGEEWLLGLWAL